MHMESGSSRPLGGKKWYESSGALLPSLGSLIRGVCVPLFPGFLGVGPPAGNSLHMLFQVGLGSSHTLCMSPALLRSGIEPVFRIRLDQEAYRTFGFAWGRGVEQ